MPFVFVGVVFLALFMIAEGLGGNTASLIIGGFLMFLIVWFCWSVGKPHNRFSEVPTISQVMIT